MTRSATQPKEKFFFYYPGYNDTRQYRRRVLAGYFDGTTIHVAQAVVFPGRKSNLTITKNGFTVDFGIPADSFNKKEGRYISSVRARGGFWEEQQAVNGGAVDYVFQPRKQVTILTIDVPEGTESTGKLFVQEVEKYLAAKGFPPKAVKTPKEKTPNPEPGQVS